MLADQVIRCPASMMLVTNADRRIVKETLVLSEKDTGVVRNVEAYWGST